MSTSYTEIDDFVIDVDTAQSVVALSCVHEGKSIQLSLYRKTGVIRITSDATPNVDTGEAPPPHGFETLVDCSGGQS